MADFRIAFRRTGIFEGGYTDDPNDNGNWTGGVKGRGTLIGTNHGVSAPVLSEYLGRTATVSDMRSLSLEVVEKIFRRKYWDKVRGDEIINQDSANEIFDDAINAGVAPAIRKAQRALGLKDDGFMGPVTLNKINGK
ncbi:MAG: glycosyl hydrolase 108 family protein [Phycisphaerales bacterium]